MKVIEGIQASYGINKAVVTVGMYDGVHLAHKLILQRVCNLAKSIGGASVLVTFEPHPRLVLNPDDHISLLSSRNEKIALLEAIGIDVLIFIPFTLEFSKTTSFEFVKTIIVDALQARKIVVGYNHYFGVNRTGDFKYLWELGSRFGFDVEEIPEQDIQNESVSSSKIRAAITKGDIIKANAYLDYEYQISGDIIPGANIFSSLGYRSWDLMVDFSLKLIPAEGLYSVTTSIDSRLWQGVVWIRKEEDEQKRIHLLLIGDDSMLRVQFVTLKFKHLVRFCSKQSREEFINSSIQAMIQQ